MIPYNCVQRNLRNYTKMYIWTYNVYNSLTSWHKIPPWCIDMLLKSININLNPMFKWLICHLLFWAGQGCMEDLQLSMQQHSPSLLHWCCPREEWGYQCCCRNCQYKAEDSIRLPLGPQFWICPDAFIISEYHWMAADFWVQLCLFPSLVTNQS